MFGMYHSKTDDHNKDVIMQGMAKADGTIRVVFATSTNTTVLLDV